MLRLGGLEGLLGGVADLAVLDGTGTHDAAVDGAGDAVALLHVQLGHLKAGSVDRGAVSDIASGGLIQHVADDEALDGLVLRGETAAVPAVDWGAAATAVLRASSIAALAGHAGRLNLLQSSEETKPENSKLHHGEILSNDDRDQT